MARQYQLTNTKTGGAIKIFNSYGAAEKFLKRYGKGDDQRHYYSIDMVKAKSKKEKLKIKKA